MLKKINPAMITTAASRMCFADAAVPLPIQVTAKLDEVRDKWAATYDARDSSTLGRVANAEEPAS